MTLNRLEAMRRGGKVKRLHTIRTINEHSVAEHTFNVIAILNQMYKLMGKPMPAHMYEAALYHDLPEQFTGDIPAPVKWGNPAIKDELDNLEADLNREYGWETNLTDEEYGLLKLADYVDLYVSVREEVVMGNCAQEVTDVADNIANHICEMEGLCEELQLWLGEEVVLV